MTAATDEFILSFPVGEEGNESLFHATLYYTQMEADTEGDFSGLVNGNIGGAAREDEMRVAIESFDVPEEFKGLIDGFLQNPDIDTDNDGINDGFSLGLFFTATSCSLSAELAVE